MIAMPKQDILLAIDQGTTSSRCLAFDKNQEVVASSQIAYQQHYPQDGWVEHSPDDIWQTTLSTCKQVIAKTRENFLIKAIGIANQRETTLLWDKNTATPIYPAIVWQDLRGADFCDLLKKPGDDAVMTEAAVTEKTGLLLDPYFSASKLKWILDNVSGARQQALRGNLLFGTVDCYLIWKLTGGKVHATDATNASRTLLYNIHTHQWDKELLEMFNIPDSVLPEVKNSADDFGISHQSILGIEAPIAGVAGDQQAALFGQFCVAPGMTKSTFGTGGFMLMNTGSCAVQSKHKLLTTIAYQLNGVATYALEGAIFNAGTTIQWLRDELKVIKNNSEIEPLLAQTPSNQGVYLVPAFTGLGAPHWHADARGIISGITRDTGRGHLVRAAIESVCFQTLDLLDAMVADSGINLIEIRVDGGMVVNNSMLQILANFLQTQVCRPTISETTALGAASLAGLQIGLYSDINQLVELHQTRAQDTIFKPKLNLCEQKRLVAGWRKSVHQCLS